MDFKKISEGILGEEDIPKTNTELFLSMVAQYFPEAIKDGEVDFTALKEEMGEFHEVGSEHYDFTWAGKQAAKKKAQEDIFGKSLRYKPQDSENPDTTENIYIEGDNLEALQLLRRTYHGKIKMIYIDPPYNTGSDFVYRDNFTMTDEELSKLSGDVVDGVRFQKNTKDSSRYHTDWLNMMYPRLKIARELLTDDGVIFISIDDNEYANLKELCDQVFGEKNNLGVYLKQSKVGGGSDSKFIVKEHEYCIVYSKNVLDTPEMFIKHDIEYLKRYKEVDDNGRFFWDTFARPGLKNPIHYDIVAPDGTIMNYGWIHGKERFEEEYKNGIVRIIPKKDGGWSVQFKQYLNQNGKKPRSMTMDFGGSIEGKNDVGTLFENEKIFSYPKSVKLLKTLFETICDNNAIVLDFFSGSATTAHAVMQLNAEDGGNRKFIMVQLPEICDEKSEAFKAGYSNICEIGKERIRRAAKKIHEDNPDAVFDDGFKVFEVGGTTIRWNTTNDDEIKQLTDEDYSTGDKDKLDFTQGYNGTDIIYEIMLRQYGIPLSTPIEKLTEISDRTYIFADAVVVCLEPEIDDKLIEKLAAVEPTPMKFVLRDSAFGDNIELKELSFRKLSALIRSHQTEEERKSKYNNYTVEFIKTDT